MIIRQKVLKLNHLSIVFLHSRARLSLKMLILKASWIGDHEAIRLLSVKEMRNFLRCLLFT
jgi:hypothetical protein